MLVCVLIVVYRIDCVYCTLKQALEYFQLIALWGFAISWPSLLRGYVTIVSHVGFTATSFGVGCLADQQSLELVTIFECSLPVAMLFSVIFSSLLSRLMACVRGRGVAFGVRQSLVLFFMAFVYYIVFCCIVLYCMILSYIL